MSEAQRLKALRQLAILDTAPEERFDRITRLVAGIFGAMASISFVDETRVWFKSAVGAPLAAKPRDKAYCSLVIAGDAPLVVPDALQDDALRHHPAVVESPHLRFYVGLALHSSDGSRVGAICAFDTEPHIVTPAQLAMLQDLAALVEQQLSLETVLEAHRRLEAGEQRYRTLFHSSLDAVILTDAQGNILAANPAACRKLNCSADELARMSMGRFIDDPQAAGVEAIRAWCTRPPYRFEILMMRCGGDAFFAEVSAAGFVDEQGEPRISFVFRDVSARRKMSQELECSRQELRRLSAALQSLQESERRHLARELHDELGQHLSALKLGVEWARLQLSEDSAQQVGPQLDAIAQTVDTTVAAVRQLSARLRPLILDELGLIAACERLIQEYRRNDSIECKLHCAADDLVICEEVATAAFRIVQEALTNVARHARAKRVDVHIAQRQGRLRIVVADDGIGIVKSDGAQHAGFGLLGMRERAYALDGDFSVDTAPGEGTRIRAELPLRHHIQNQS